MLSTLAISLAPVLIIVARFESCQVGPSKIGVTTNPLLDRICKKSTISFAFFIESNL